MLTNQTLTLRDTRDNNSYTVAKLLDGKCWMTQNLRYNTNYLYKGSVTYGNYYTASQAQNICPNGWKLPAWSNKDLSGLKANYNQNNATQPPANFVKAGYYYNGLQQLDSVGYWWTSDGWEAGAGSYFLYLDNSVFLSYCADYVNCHHGMPIQLYYGASVRCISNN